MDRATPLQQQSVTPAPAPAFARAGVREAWFGRCASARFGEVARLAKDKSGVAAIEYGLLCALIALAVVTGITQVGSEVSDGYSHVEEEVAKATGNKGGNGKDRGKGNDKGNGKNK